jgi:hypothetical protein
MESHVAARQTGSWTNEKHLHFLNTMEASFVRAMFENNSGILRLDRYLPDSSESTLDLKAQRIEKHANAGKYDKPSSLSLFCLRRWCNWRMLVKLESWKLSL